MIPLLGETAFRRLLRAAAWIAIAGVALGAVVEWTAISRAREATDALTRLRLVDGAVMAAVFWGFLWVPLPVAIWAFGKFLAWPEKALAWILTGVMLTGLVSALALRSAVG